MTARETPRRWWTPKGFLGGLGRLYGLGDVARAGKYPVTVEEYQRFVDERGYEEARYWDPEGWKLKEAESWSEPGSWSEQLEAPNRPVVEVSWYEAVAYGRWLGELRREEVRLPIEAEWEKAATPARGLFPWGEEEPDTERANFAPEHKPNVGAATPVGIYPAGAGPSGHCDLVGNVWEWCANEVQVKSADGVWRTRRGGGWLFPAVSLWTPDHNRFPASNRFVDVGFRVAVCPASTAA